MVTCNRFEIDRLTRVKRACLVGGLETMSNKQSVASKQKSKVIGLFNKVAITTIIGIGFTLNVTYADDAALDTVYHVYVDDAHIGTVDNKDIITSYIDEQIETKEAADDTYSYAAKQEISYVPERVFDPSAANQEVLSTIEETVEIQVNAYQLAIDNDTVGYFKDEATAKQTIYEYKAKYVDKDILNQLEQDKSETTENEEQVLAVGDTTVLDVSMSEKISYQKEIVSEKDILTVEQGVELLEKGTLEDKAYKVEKGDVLGSIASKHNMDAEQLLALNPTVSQDSVLQIGQEVNVTVYAPFADVVFKKEELVEEEISYEKEVQTSEDLYKGDSELKQEGQKGAKEVHYALELVNGKVANKEVVSEEVKQEPVKEILVKGTKVVPSRGTGDFAWPAVGGYVSSHMG